MIRADRKGRFATQASSGNEKFTYPVYRQYLEQELALSVRDEKWADYNNDI